MSEAPAFVLDASALLAYLQGEPGAEVVAEALIQAAAINADLFTLRKTNVPDAWKKAFIQSLADWGLIEVETKITLKPVKEFLLNLVKAHQIIGRKALIANAKN